MSEMFVIVHLYTPFHCCYVADVVCSDGVVQFSISSSSFVCCALSYKDFEQTRFVCINSAVIKGGA